MVRKISNLVFAGGGILGISYLGALDYLYQYNLLMNLKRTAGTSAGAIAACITSLNLPFDEMTTIIGTLDYDKVPEKENPDETDIYGLPKEVADVLEELFGDINCLYRLVTSYGWYSTRYLYEWLRSVIEQQFNHKSQPPYTFADFKDPSLHKNNHPFYDLYVIGTNLNSGTSQVFSYETTPNTEVALAVQASISIPLFFEAASINQPDESKTPGTQLFCDGGVLNNYPIKLFDSAAFHNTLMRGVNMETLGLRFMSTIKPNKINNLLDYIISLVLTYSHIQLEEYYNSPMDRIRSITIDSMKVSFLDFNISPGDDTYRFLYQQGYQAAKNYYENIPPRQLNT